MTFRSVFAYRLLQNSHLLVPDLFLLQVILHVNKSVSNTMDLQYDVKVRGETKSDLKKLHCGINLKETQGTAASRCTYHTTLVLFYL